MRSMRILLALGVLSAVSAAPVFADVIYSNGTPDLETGPWSDVDALQIVADDFMLSPNIGTTILDVHWWGYYSGGNSPMTDDFYIIIFNDNAGKPSDSPLAFLNVGDVGRTDTNQDVTGVTGGMYDLYRYGVSIAPIALAPDTTYWISIVNDTSDDRDDNWAWAPSAEQGNAAWTSIDDGVSWSTFDQEFAFYLTNDPIVPEPATMTLLGLGLAGLAVRMRRRQG